MTKRLSRDGISWGQGAALGLLLVLAVALTCLALRGLLHVLEGPSGIRPASSPAQPLPPEPRLEPNPQQALEELRRREDSILHHYKWVDRPSGLVQIPIERAMELLAERGLPARHRRPSPES